MHNSHSLSKTLPVPFIPTLAAVAAALVIAYIGLLAIVMTYGALQMQSAQALRDTSATVGVLETKYLADITEINNTNPEVSGFTKPLTIAYVTGLPSRPSVSMRTQ